MKTLLLVRHAKSCWKNNLPDFDRPIKKRGIKDANLISKDLADLSPDIILCSAANRTRLTADIFIKNLSLENVNIKYLKDLYDFSGEALIEVIQTIDNSCNTVMVFGHNYALTNFVNTFGNKYVDNVTTSGFVKINFDIKSWKNLSKGKTEKIVFPKHLK
ncbi:MAG: histidine phosphatase family protein [Lacinutrix sp.]|uniref:SixA phosphatase family protein n=1 Tax=Lacinutrix sp. TaxID=1937692 RepID=UPI00309D739D